MNTPNYNVNQRHYDSSYEDHLGMYDHLPYVTNRDICNKEHIQLTFGNVIKPMHYSLDMNNIRIISNHE